KTTQGDAVILRVSHKPFVITVERLEDHALTSLLPGGGTSIIPSRIVALKNLACMPCSKSISWSIQPNSFPCRSGWKSAALPRRVQNTPRIHDSRGKDGENTAPPMRAAGKCLCAFRNCCRNGW